MEIVQMKDVYALFLQPLEQPPGGKRGKAAVKAPLSQDVMDRAFHIASVIDMARRCRGQGLIPHLKQMGGPRGHLMASRPAASPMRSMIFPVLPSAHIFISAIRIILPVSRSSQHGFPIPVSLGQQDRP